MKRVLLLCAGLVLLPACVTNKKPISSKDRRKGQVVLANTIAQQEAKLVDLPVPLNAKPIPSHFWIDDDVPGNVMLGYHVAMTKEELVSFCVAEMERIGWEQTVYCDAVEGLIFFERPGRFCTVSVRDKRQGVDLIIFSGNKCL